MRALSGASPRRGEGGPVAISVSKCRGVSDRLVCLCRRLAARSLLLRDSAAGGVGAQARSSLTPRRIIRGPSMARPLPESRRDRWPRIATLVAKRFVLTNGVGDLRARADPGGVEPEVRGFRPRDPTKEMHAGGPIVCSSR